MGEVIVCHYYNDAKANFDDSRSNIKLISLLHNQLDDSEES